MEVYIISGLPSTGKTTLISVLKKRYFDRCLFIPEFLDPLPEFVYKAWNSNLENKIKAQDWVVKQYSRKNQKILKEQNGRPVIMERGLTDAFAFSWALGREVYDHTVQFAGNFTWVPSVVILLSVSDLTIKKRIMARDSLDEKEWVNLWQPYFFKVREGYQKARELRNEDTYIDFGTDKKLVESQLEIVQMFDSLLAQRINREREASYLFEGREQFWRFKQKLWKENH